MALARIAFARRESAGAARLWTKALADVPAAAADPVSSNRFQAARAAALASQEPGQAPTSADQGPSSDAWRAQAISWLETDLEAFATLVETGTHAQRAAVARQLGRWRVDPCLERLRNDAFLAGLAGSERDRLRAFWSRVEAIQAQAATPSPPSRGKSW